MIYIVTSWSGEHLLEGAGELNEFLNLPDHQGMRFRVETAPTLEEHEELGCGDVREDLTDVRQPQPWPNAVELALWGLS